VAVIFGPGSCRRADRRRTETRRRWRGSKRRAAWQRSGLPCSAGGRRGREATSGDLVKEAATNLVEVATTTGLGRGGDDSGAQSKRRWVEGRDRHRAVLSRKEGGGV
jgi:hypothetical protein